MKAIVFSDVHSNLEALDSFFEAAQPIRKKNVVVCLGDIVGYNANPNECVDAMKVLEQSGQFRAVIGNHDFVVSSNIDPENFNNAARAAVNWQVNVVTLENKKWLAALPGSVTEDMACGKAMFVHGSPLEPMRFDYILSGYAALSAAKVMLNEDISVAFIGHSHAPCLFAFKDVKQYADRYKSRRDMTIDERLAISRHVENTMMFYHGSMLPLDEDIIFGENDIVIVNVGSVGQPRDYNPKGCFVEFDDEAKSIKYHRFDYPIADTQRKIIRAGLPESLASRLEIGS